MTESEMKAIREMFVDVAGAMAKSVTDQVGERLDQLEKGLRGEIRDVEGRLSARIDSLDKKVDSLQAGLDLLTSKRLARIEARLDALEEVRQ